MSGERRLLHEYLDLFARSSEPDQGNHGTPTESKPFKPVSRPIRVLRETWRSFKSPRQRHDPQYHFVGGSTEERRMLSVATSLLVTLDAWDRYTAGHSAAVAVYARDIAKQLGLTEEQQQVAFVCGLVHDLGKVQMPRRVLEKSSALTTGERREMEMHPTIGERIVAQVEDFREIAKIVRHHHERWDGRGYPDGLSGEDIPLMSRIVAVAEAYNAMTSDRAYQEAMPSRVARMHLAQGVGTQFDIAVVAAFEAILAAADDDYRLATREDFAPADMAEDFNS